MPDDTAHDEFDSVAAWTAEVLTGMPAPARVPGACRGSANPTALGWLVHRLPLGSGATVVDLGGGIGGPAAWIEGRTGARPIVLEPMGRAAGWARRLFGLPAVTASGSEPPLRPGTADVALALAVLSTVEDAARFVRAAHDLLVPGGRLGLLEYVADGPIEDAPSGNRFFQRAELTELLSRAGFREVDGVAAADLPSADPEWGQWTATVKEAVAAAHPGDRRIAEADAQEHRFGELLDAGLLVQVAVVAERPVGSL